MIGQCSKCDMSPNNSIHKNPKQVGFHEYVEIPPPITCTVTERFNFGVVAGIRMIYNCLTCGALIDKLDLERHNDWHNKHGETTVL